MVPMTPAVKQALIDGKAWQEVLEEADQGKKKKGEIVLLPKFSCHSLRHTCATRLCEAGINMKVIQDFLGHADIRTTMNIYTDATKDFKEGSQPIQRIPCREDGSGSQGRLSETYHQITTDLPPYHQETQRLAKA